MRARALYLAFPTILLLAAACGVDASTVDPGTDAGNDAGPGIDAAKADTGTVMTPDAGPLCSANNGGCSADALCTEAAGKVSCACKKGFSGDGLKCTDIDECATANGGCATNATCTNTSGSRTCTCTKGYAGDGVTCTDVDECAVANGGCDVNATCTNSPGSKTCACKTGYAGSGVACALTTLTIATDTNFATTNTGGRTCADGGDMVSYSLVALTGTTATLSAAASAGCLAAGDDVLVINLQGTDAATTNTGNYELLSVKTVAGATVTFNTAKTKFFGDGAANDTNIGTAATNQRVVLQRVPRYGNVVVSAGVTLSADGWNGTKGGIFALSAAGAVTINGAISMTGSGYTGGAFNDVVNTTGQQGESFDGLGLLMTQTSTAGRGGGGRGDSTGCDSFGVSGGGGGHGAAGGNAVYATCGGVGGATYGDAALAKLFFGSGGGAGGTDNTLADNPRGGFGGRGGGIIYIKATGAVTGTGTLFSRGTAGEGDLAGVDCSSGSTTECWDYSGAGGGGAGGSILVSGASFTATADAAGGLAGNAWSGAAQLAGGGSVGRVKTP